MIRLLPLLVLAAACDPADDPTQSDDFNPLSWVVEGEGTYAPDPTLDVDVPTTTVENTIAIETGEKVSRHQLKRKRSC